MAFTGKPKAITIDAEVLGEQREVTYDRGRAEIPVNGWADLREVFKRLNRAHPQLPILAISLHGLSVETFYDVVRTLGTGELTARNPVAPKYTRESLEKTYEGMGSLTAEEAHERKRQLAQLIKQGVMTEGEADALAHILDQKTVRDTGFPKDGAGRPLQPARADGSHEELPMSANALSERDKALMDAEDEATAAGHGLLAGSPAHYRARGVQIPPITAPGLGAEKDPRDASPPSAAGREDAEPSTSPERSASSSGSPPAPQPPTAPVPFSRVSEARVVSDTRKSPEQPSMSFACERPPKTERKAPEKADGKKLCPNRGCGAELTAENSSKLRSGDRVHINCPAKAEVAYNDPQAPPTAAPGVGAPPPENGAPTPAGDPQEGVAVAGHHLPHAAMAAVTIRGFVEALHAAHPGISPDEVARIASDCEKDVPVLRRASKVAIIGERAKRIAVEIAGGADA